MSFMEKYGMPILLGQYTRGVTQDESQKLAEELASMTEDSVIVTPSDINLSLHEAQKTSSVDLYERLMNYCNSEISKAILSQTLTTEIGSGSLAAAAVHYKVRQEVVMADINIVEEAINRLIHWFVDLNFGSGTYPEFHIRTDQSDNLQQIERDFKISQTGNTRLTKQYWMRTYGLKEDEVAEIS